MSGIYTVTRAATALSTTNDLATLVAAAAKPLRVHLIDITGAGAAAALNTVLISRSTGGTSGTGGITPTPTDPSMPAASFAAYTGWSAQPTIGATLWRAFAQPARGRLRAASSLLRLPPMNNDKLPIRDTFGAGLIARPTMAECIALGMQYRVRCLDAQGREKWVEDFHNTVMTVGKNFVLDTVFRGSSYTAAFYFGLISSVSYSAIAAADTMSSHAGWTEAGASNAPNYDESARPAATFGSAASAGAISNSAVSVFTIAATGTVKGAFLTTNSTKGGTTGTLINAGLFSQGDRAVVDNDVIQVSGTWSM